MTAALPDGWTLHRVELDHTGRDKYGWLWGSGPIWVLSDGVDSLSVKAPCPVIALALVHADGWPPKKVKRYNWEYE